MVFTRLLRRLHGRERALPIRKRPQTFRPQFEQLEPRQMLSAASLTNVALAPPAIFAGSQTTLSGNVTAFDGGATLSIDWGDGTAAQTAQVGAASSQISQSHVYADEGSYVASIQSADTAPARLSTSSTGTQANGASYSVSISGDGRYVAFSSQAKNLVPDDPNYGPDVFVRDRLDGTTTRVSVGSSVKFGTNPSISADGRYVVFSGSALNLPGHTGNEPEVWLYDRDTEQTTLISNYWDINGEGLFPQSFFPVISADGRYVAFTSNGAHLANINTDSSVYNVFLYDRVTGVMTSVTDQLENMGTRADGNSYVKSISADGRYVVFESDADNLVDIASLGGDTNNKRDVFVFDRETGTTTRISVDAHNNQLDTFSQGGSISGDGHYIVFTSTAGDLVSPSTTAPNDILLYDAQTRSTARVSVAPDGTPADHASYNAAISADGRFVTFSSAADNLVLGGDTNGVADIFIKDLSSGAIRRLSTGASGQGDGRSGVPVISADAHFVAFLSAAKNLVLGDTNEYQDAFVADAMPLTATASVTVTSASPGSLDAPFGNGGVVVTNNGGEVYDMAIQPVDGKIIVVGNGFQVVRYNTDGTLDRVFNNAGLADQTATSVAVDAQNRILVTGYGNGDFTLVRYNPNGTVDTSFGSGGVVSTQFGPGGANAWSVAIDAQGRIVVAGDAIGTAAGDTDFVVARYNSDGTLDTSFGIGGQVTTDFPNINSTDSALNVVLDAEGRILLVGTSSAGDDTGEAYTALARYNPNGTLDTSFGTGGLVTTNFADGWESATSAAIDGQGRIVVSSTGNFWDFAVARYTADGTLDTSFGSGGLMVRDLGGLDQSFGVAIDNLGRIVVAGKTSDASGDKLAIVRLKDDGTLDQSFANGGVATPDIGYSRANTVAIDAQGRIVAAGYDAIGPDFSTRGFAVARFLADVAPQITNLAVDRSTISQGQGVTLSGTFDDLADSSLSDAHTVLVEWGEGQSQVVNLAPGQRGFSASHTYVIPSGYSPDGVFTIRATVTDPAGGSGSANTTVRVNDLPPSVFASITSNPTIAEGGSVSVIVDASDGNEPLSGLIDWGDGSATPLGGYGHIHFAGPHVYGDDGTFTIRATVTDSSGLTSQSLAYPAVMVSNVLPVSNIIVSNSAYQVGAPITVTGVATDPGFRDTLNYSWAAYQGDSQTPLSSDSGVNKTSFSFTPPAAGNYRISLTVTDDDGSSVSTQLLTVGASSPTVPQVVIPAGGGTVEIRREGSDAIVLLNGSQVDRRPLQDLTGLKVVGSSAPETFRVDIADWHAYNATLTNGLTIVAGEGSDDVDTLVLTGGSASRVSYRTSGREAGTISIVGLDGYPLTINYSEFEPIIDQLNAADRTFSIGTDGSQTIHVAADGTGTTSIDDAGTAAFESISFVNPTGTLAVNGGVGDDNIVVDSLDPQFAASIVVNAGEGNDQVIASAAAVPLTIDGGPGDDLLVGGSVSNIIIGGAGTNTLAGGTGSNQIAAGPNDVVTSNVGDVVDVVNFNSAPVALVDTVATLQGTPVSGNVLTNDRDPDNGGGVPANAGLTAVLIANPSHGTLVFDGATGDFTYTPSGSFFGTDSFSYKAVEGQGAESGLATVAITVNQPYVAPTVAADHASATVNEGQQASNTGTFAGDDTVTLSASAGTVVKNSNGTWSWSLATNDGPPQTQAVTITAQDSTGGQVSATFDLTVNNVAPTVEAIQAPVAPVSLSQSTISASARFTDPGTADTHTGVWSWGDGTQSAATISATADGAHLASATHKYTAAGVYTLTLTVTDKDGGSAQSIFHYVVVYDPSGGFVTGGGAISSPAGAWATDPTMTGPASFGFVSQYKKGATVPTGNTEFQFQAGNLNFHSSSYEWLVVAGARAQFKGTGTINGQGNYGFLLTAIDGSVKGGGGVDKFRIKIWDMTTGVVVYDNQRGQTDDSSPATAISNGNIVIHG